MVAVPVRHREYHALPSIARRNFEEHRCRHERLVGRALSLIGEIYGIEARIKDTPRPERLLAWATESATADRFFAWCDEVLADPSLTPKHPIRKAASCAAGRKAELRAFLSDPDVPIDTIDHRRLREFLDLRIKDGAMRRMIDKWLKAGVLDSGVLHRSETGAPQGGVVSLILSNIFLHHVLNSWMIETVRTRVGAFRQLRFADDYVIALESRRDGERVLAAPGRRLADYGLTLHPTKTRQVDLRPRAGGHASSSRFDYLGFTHLRGKSRKGRWVVRQFTAKARLARAVKSVWYWCKEHRLMPLGDQCRHLAGVIRGHCACCGLTGNGKRLSGFRDAVAGSWRRWLGRRHRNGRISWDRFNAILARSPLPKARVTRSIYAPLANRPCEEPGAPIAHTRVRGGRGSATTPSTRPRPSGNT